MDGIRLLVVSPPPASVPRPVPAPAPVVRTASPGLLRPASPPTLLLPREAREREGEEAQLIEDKSSDIGEFPVTDGNFCIESRPTNRSGKFHTLKYR